MLSDLNSVLLEGNLTRDPALKTLPNGATVCNMSIATNRYYKQNNERQEEVSYFDIEVWAKVAERCAEYLKKGSGLRAVGRLKQDRWQDTEGKTQYRVRIVAEHVEFRPSYGSKQNGAPVQKQKKEEASA